MVIYTTRLTRRKLVSAILIVCIAICSVVALNRKSVDTVSVTDSPAMQISERKLKTNEDRMSLLKECGWEAEAEPAEFMEVRIPEEFDDVYGKYNDIQKRQGMDLEKYAGKRAVRYTYKISNHPSGESGVVANLIVYKNKLIGADVCSPELNGFMHGITEQGDETSEMK